MCFILLAVIVGSNWTDHLKMDKNGGVFALSASKRRGISLYNKIDAYKLQSEGLNTYEANNHLGFGDDLRDFSDAAKMLNALNINKIRLITTTLKKLMI